jgi:hypothetical protein
MGIWNAFMRIWVSNILFLTQDTTELETSFCVLIIPYLEALEKKKTA